MILYLAYSAYAMRSKRMYLIERVEVTHLICFADCKRLNSITVK